MAKDQESQIIRELNMTNDHLTKLNRQQQEEIHSLRNDNLRIKTQLERCNRELDITLKDKRDTEELLEKERDLYNQIKRADDMLY